MTFAWRNSAMALSSRPSSPARISSLCWPSADGGMFDGLDHVTRGCLRIIERLGDRVDLPAGDSHCFELGQPGIGAIMRQRLVDHAVDQRPVLDPRAVAGKARIARPFRMAEHLGDA